MKNERHVCCFFCGDPLLPENHREHKKEVKVAVNFTDSGRTGEFYAHESCWNTHVEQNRDSDN